MRKFQIGDPVIYINLGGSAIPSGILGIVIVPPDCIPQITEQEYIGVHWYGFPKIRPGDSRDFWWSRLEAVK